MKKAVKIWSPAADLQQNLPLLELLQNKNDDVSSNNSVLQYQRNINLRLKKQKQLKGNEQRSQRQLKPHSLKREQCPMEPEEQQKHWTEISQHMSSLNDVNKTNSILHHTSSISGDAWNASESLANSTHSTADLSNSAVGSFNTCAICGATFDITTQLVQHVRFNHRRSRYKRPSTSDS